MSETLVDPFTLLLLGPRICLGQQFALTEASFLLVRLLQEFDALEPIDRIEMQKMKKGLGVTMWYGFPIFEAPLRHHANSSTLLIQAWRWGIRPITQSRKNVRSLVERIHRMAVHRVLSMSIESRL